MTFTLAVSTGGGVRASTSDVASEVALGRAVSLKIRWRAAWYFASLSAYDFCTSAEDGAEVLGDAGPVVGRLRIFSAGWNAAGGGGRATLVPDPELTSSGIGAFLFLRARTA